MKRLLWLAVLTIVLSIGCKDPEEGPLSPPIIDPPMLECAKTVNVKGFVPGANIDIYANGIRIGGGVSDAPWGQSFTVSPELVLGQDITARQTFEGVISPASAPIKVMNARKFYGGLMPKPKLNEPIYECGGAIGVSELAPGGILRVYSDGIEIGRVDGCGAGQWLHVSPQFAIGRTITADVELCGVKSPVSDGVVVIAKPTSLPQLEVGEIYENGKYVNVYNITNGARVQTASNGTVFDDMAYSGGGQIVRVPSTVNVGDALTSVQELCGTISEPSDPSVVLPCSELPPPTLGGLCPGDNKIKILVCALGSHIKVYRNGIIAADGGGDEIMLLAPAQGGETYTATQSLGSCLSAMSLPMVVSCSKPAVNSVTIPYAGRAVSIAVDPSDDKRILVASETGGMFRSENSGLNWHHVSSSNHFIFSDVTFLPFKTNAVIATTAEDSRVKSGGGIWRSLNNGSTWKQVTLTTPTASCVNNISGYCVCVQPGTNRIWAGTSCGLVFSDDGGANWTFQPAVTGYNPQPVFSVETPTTTKIAIIVDAGLLVSTDQGGTFTAVPFPVNKLWWADGPHNQLATGVGDENHLFYTLYHKVPSDDKFRRSVFFSSDFGSNWTSILEDKLDGLNRPIYVRTSGSVKDEAGKYMVYFGDGSCGFKRRSINTGTGGPSGDWSSMVFDHCDPSDVAFANDGKTPLILTTDGGIHNTSDKGDNWKLVGGGPAGYNALQITEVIAQLQKEGRSTDLYFGTQDNAIWASSDMGGSWPGRVDWEGFFMNISRSFVPDAQNRINGVACGACNNYIAKRLLAGAGGFPNPTRTNGSPKMIAPAQYIHNAFPFDSIGFMAMLSTNTGSSWDSIFKVLQRPIDQPTVSGPAATPTLYIPYLRAATIPGTGSNQIGLKRVTGTLSGAGAMVSEVNGISSLGIFPTMFAWYAPIGVDPADPEFIIIQDIIDGFVKISTDGGTSWRNDTMLTRLVTQDGKLEFKISDAFSQVTNIAFDPDCPQHILVGTVQAGIMTSYDRGQTWGKIPGTELIPFVSRFAFTGNKKMVVSSYGRGLWFFDNECYQVPLKKKSMPSSGDSSFVYHGGRKIMLKDFRDVSPFGDVSYFLVKGGNITGYILNRDQKIEQVMLSGGEILGYDIDLKPVQLPFKVVQGLEMGSIEEDKGLVDLIRNKELIKGLIIVNGRFKAPILSKSDLSPQDMPQRQAPEPYLIVTESGRDQDEKTGPYLKVRGKNFDPKAPLLLFIDGQEMKVEDLSYDGEGGFSFRVPMPGNLGRHTILVTQKTSKGEISAAHAFNKTTSDNKQ